ncbi:hypothetical protein [Salegentibacter flavus]|uniref:Uncharacterized protein n=1 Tax=Salegentibacter flavus TaxID=287099 RepID=A0A1I4Y4J1_9FLAO|nr:hypothetical protein [Salegentibacter flavus]SFN33002.1 hypothetical protein SAMN05660413_00517 [Salegentibacter flavus]
MKLKTLILSIIIGLAAVLVYKYSVHPVVLRTLFPDKIWPHRVNSIGKLQESSEIFSGMELDVVWENGNFDVNHPPAESIQLYLDEYIKHIPISGHYGLWVDYKNLKAPWAEKSANYLDSLFSKVNLNKDRVYIESHFPQHLNPFLNKGFKISYYLPSGLNQIRQKDSLKKVLDRINLNLKDKPGLFISAPFADYNFMLEHFPERKKLLWHLGGLYGPRNKLNIYRALFDKNVEVVLLPFKSKVGDR